MVKNVKIINRKKYYLYGSRHTRPHAKELAARIRRTNGRSVRIFKKTDGYYVYSR